MTLALDHLVINTRFDTDAAQTLFAQLGFTLMPRGYHTLGSINHAIVFDGHYLELIGLPVDGATIREEIAASPLGADGLVYRSDDPQHTFDALHAAGFDATPPQHFSRPVTGLGDARFVTVRLKPGPAWGGRVYFCQHLTPQLVFRDEWKAHRNGAYALAALHVVDADRDAYARLGEASGGFRLAFWTRADFDAYFGAFASQVTHRSPRFAAITLRTPRWSDMTKLASAAGLPAAEENGRTLVALPGFDTVLEFIQ